MTRKLAKQIKGIGYRITLAFHPATWRRLQEMRAELGLENSAEVVRLALAKLEELEYARRDGWQMQLKRSGEVTDVEASWVLHG